MSFKRIEVAVGVLFRQCDDRQFEVLVAQRLVKDRYFEKWEFPGGKIEQGESPFLALRRELSEELEIDVIKATPLIRLDHNYPDRHVRLHVFEVKEFTEQPHGKEGQAIQWLKPQQCAELDFLQANEPIVNAVVLPKFVLITDIAKYGLDKTMDCIVNLQKKHGDIIVQLREKTNDLKVLSSYKNKITPLLKQGSLLMLNNEPDIAKQLGFDGVHLNADRASRLVKRAAQGFKWVGVSCHDSSELKHAEKIADFALLSPIQTTNSHPSQSPKGWDFFSSKVKVAALPVYALGGLSFQDCEKARLNQAQGVAMLSAAWV